MNYEQAGDIVTHTPDFVTGGVVTMSADGGAD
jgi:hypothetical protein